MRGKLREREKAKGVKREMVCVSLRVPVCVDLCVCCVCRSVCVVCVDLCVCGLCGSVCIVCVDLCVLCV